MIRPKMFLRKQTQSWYVKIGGKFIALGKDEQEARRKYAALLPPESNDETDDEVGALVTAYLDYVAANKAPGTFRLASAHLHSFSAHLGDSFPLADVRGFHLQQWADKRFAGRSDTYKNQGMRTVKACWSWGASVGLIPADPLRPVRLPPAGQREVFFTIDQWRAIVDGAKGPFRDYLTVALESGLRPQEIHTAQVCHFQPQFGSLVFERKKSKGKKRRRVIPLNPASLEIVKRLVAQRAAPSDPIFLNSEGRAWCKDAVNCAMRRLRAKLGSEFDGLCATSLRHSFAHASLVAGGDPMHVAKAMGHTTTRMIETRYGHVEANLDFLRKGKGLPNNPFLYPETPGPGNVPVE